MTTDDTIAGINDNRKRRTTITFETLKNIYIMMQNNKRPKEISRDLNIALPNIYNLSNKIFLTDELDASLRELVLKLGRKKDELVEQQVLLANIVQDDPALTQKRIRVCLANKGVSRSQGTISLYLKQLGVSRKRAVKFGKKEISLR
ncbi:hypothetical protein CDIK_2358 [Cucumispora dikerogammari]|nr:hypothetical protein CDIK_2358 [Cucumispora dikerogammari]